MKSLTRRPARSRKRPCASASGTTGFQPRELRDEVTRLERSETRGSALPHFDVLIQGHELTGCRAVLGAIAGPSSLDVAGERVFAWQFHRGLALVVRPEGDRAGYNATGTTKARLLRGAEAAYMQLTRLWGRHLTSRRGTPDWRSV